MYYLIDTKTDKVLATSATREFIIIIQAAWLKAKYPCWISKVN